MLEVFLYGVVACAGVLVTYTVYDGIFTFFAHRRERKNAAKRRKR